MKKLLLFTSVFALLFVNTNAQNAIPNPGFETWTNQGSYEDPDGWGTLNSQTSALGVYTALKASGANAHSGSFALNLVTKYISFINLTAPGAAGTNGSFNQGCNCFLGGVPFTLHPDSITGWYKYTPQGTDTAIVDIRLSKWNTTTNVRDEVASATWTKSTSVTSYTRFSKALTYSLTATPDTMVILIFSSWSGAGSSNNNSSLFIDDLALTFAATPVSATATSTNIMCNGSCTGTASVTASGGTSPYTYLWSNSQTTANATGLCAGTATVTVTDAAAGIATASVTITQPATALSATAAATNATCNGAIDGTATVNAGGGTSPYTFLWSANANSQTTQTASGLAANTYSVTVTDANGCTKTTSATVTQPTAVTATVSSTDETFTGASDGTASVTASGGSSPYTYLWSTAATTSSISNLAPGAYSVTVTDASGCSMVGSTTVNAAGCALTATATATNATCGGSNGTATVSVTAPPQTHVITVGPNNTLTFSPATISAVVGDTIKWVWATGSHTTTSTTIPVGAATWNSNINSTTQTFKYVVTMVGAYNYKCSPHVGSGMVGVINVAAASYTYSWTGGQNTVTATGLPAGTYSVTATDANSCTAIASVTVGGTGSPVATTSSTITNCGSSTGTATVTASGGTSPYSYLWGNSQTSATATGLGAGTYNVTVTDAGGCTTTASATVTSPGGPTATVTESNATCNGASNGAVAVNASGGTTPYSYLWSNGATTVAVTGLVAGNYSVTVTDANSCTATASVTVSQPTAIALTVTTTNATNGQSNGFATVTASGGTSPYTYLWNTTPPQTTATAAGLAAGNYSVTVTDANNCTANINATVSNTNGIDAISVSSFVKIFPNPNNGIFSVTIQNEKMQNVNIIVYNVLGEVVYKMSGTKQQTSTIDLSLQREGVYFYQLLNSSSVLETGKFVISK